MSFWLVAMLFAAAGVLAVAAGDYQMLAGLAGGAASTTVALLALVHRLPAP